MIYIHNLIFNVGGVINNFADDPKVGGIDDSEGISLRCSRISINWEIG